MSKKSEIILLLMFISFNKVIAEESPMVFIPAGEFIMSKTQLDPTVNHTPSQKTYLDAYYIGKYEVTKAEYEEFILDRGYERREFWSPKAWEFIQKNKSQFPFGWDVDGFNDPMQPVMGVSWYEAAAYAKWADGRLPKEAEWEKAARGNDGRRYPWGNKFDPVGMAYRALMRPTIVGSSPIDISPYGLHDVSGNLAEWIMEAPESSILKTVRGGSWFSNRRHFQLDYRRSEHPAWGLMDVGLRIVREVAQQKRRENKQ